MQVGHVRKEIAAGSLIHRTVARPSGWTSLVPRRGRRARRTVENDPTHRLGSDRRNLRAAKPPPGRVVRSPCSAASSRPDACPSRARGEDPGAAVQLRTYRLALLSDPSYAAAVAPTATTEARVGRPGAGRQAGARRPAQPGVRPRAGDPVHARARQRRPQPAQRGGGDDANGPCGAQPCFTTDQLAAGCIDDSMRRTRYVVGQLLGARNYEIGHLVLGAATPWSSYPSSAGTEYRAFGCSGSTTPTGDAFAIDRLAHELGHQLGAGATFDGDLLRTEERNLDTAVEPGSGASVMGAAGTCGADDLQAHPDPWFSATSQEEIGWYVTGDGLVPDNAVAAEVQSVALRDFDGADSFKLLLRRCGDRGHHPWRELHAGRRQGGGAGRDADRDGLEGAAVLADRHLRRPRLRDDLRELHGRRRADRRPAGRHVHRAGQRHRRRWPPEAGRHREQRQQQEPDRVRRPRPRPSRCARRSR